MRPTFDLLFGVLGLRPPRTAVTAAESELLASFAAGARTVVEVGVAEGVTSARLLDAMGADGVLFMVDPYPARLRLERLLRTSGTRWIARRGVRRFGTRAVFVDQASVAAATSWRQASPALVFLDACHDFAAVEADLRAWSPRLERGGVIAVHDAIPCPSRPELHAEVGGCRAVCEALGSGWNLVASAESLAVVRRASGEE